jgi:hypothetical protein
MLPGVGKTLASGTGSWLPVGAPGEIKLWDVAGGQERATLARFQDMIVALAFSVLRHIGSAGEPTDTTIDQQDEIEVVRFGFLTIFLRFSSTITGHTRPGGKKGVLTSCLFFFPVQLTTRLRPSCLAWYNLSSDK